MSSGDTVSDEATSKQHGEATFTESEEKSRFSSEVTRVFDGLNENISTVGPIIVTKNDNIEVRVDELIGSINREKPVLLVGKSKDINKLISIVEIVKSKVSLKQYNKLIQQRSVNNPNYSKAKMAQLQKEETLEKKVYFLPILFIYLVPRELSPDLDWTLQEAS